MEWVQKYIENLDENYAPENFHECAIAVSNEMLRVLQDSGHSGGKLNMQDLRDDFDAIHERILISRERKIPCIGYAIAANGLSKVFSRKILTEGSSMEALTEGMFTLLRNGTFNVSSDVRFAFVHATLHQTYRRLLAAGVPGDDLFVRQLFRNIVERKIEGAPEAYFKPPALEELEQGLRAERAEANTMNDVRMLPNPPEHIGVIQVSDIIRVLPPIDKN
jgi:hypothetical protein